MVGLRFSSKLPEDMCLELKFPVRIKRGPNCSKISVYCSFVILCRSGQYTAPMLVSLPLYVIEIAVDWMYSLWTFCCNVCLIVRLIRSAVPSCKGKARTSVSIFHSKYLPPALF